MSKEFNMTIRYSGKTCPKCASPLVENIHGQNWCSVLGYKLTSEKRSPAPHCGFGKNQILKQDNDKWDRP